MEASIEPPPDHREQTSFLGSRRIGRLNEEGFRFKSETIRLIDECRDAIERLPAGSRGIVIGSGPNTRDWHQRGWETVDISPNVNPTYSIERPTFVVDANHLVETEGITKSGYDFFLSEYLTTQPTAGTPVEGTTPEGTTFYEPAVGHENLLVQAAHCLKVGGRLIIKTVDFGSSQLSNQPKSEEYAILLKQYGFAPVLEIHQFEDFTDPQERAHGVQVTWYAEKVSEPQLQVKAGETPS